MRIFSVDAETDGLYGPTLAIGVVVREDGVTVASFQGRVNDTRLRGVANPWVRENVIPAIAGITTRFKNAEELEEAFWSFYKNNKEDALVVAHCAAPVESGLFRRCIKRDASRTFEGPFPLHEVGTALLMKGEDPSSVDSYLKSCGLSPQDEHNPLADALWAAIAWERLMK